jgi:hypothetical protein
MPLPNATQEQLSGSGAADSESLKHTGPRPSEYFDANNFDSFKARRQYYIVRNRRPESRGDRFQRPPRTIVILGTGRSGTTMTAGILRLLGEDLQGELNSRLENVEITNCLLDVYRSFLWWKIVVLRWKFSKIMHRRQQRWRRSAFKSPYLSPFIWMLSGTIENPYFVIPTRNALETSFGLNEYLWGGWRLSLLATTLQQVFLTMFSITTRRPVLLSRTNK